MRALNFGNSYKDLPDPIKKLADRNFALLKNDPSHPSLHFKKIGRFRSARVGRNFRALAVEVEDGLLWFWLGSHAKYERLIGG